MKSSRLTGCAANAWFARFLFLLISLTLLMVLMPSAHAAELPEVCYPTSVQCSEDKTELKKIYDLTPEADPRKHAGCYMYLKKHRYIFLSNQLKDAELRLVMAHELGHALLDCKSNCYFIRNKTLLLVSKLERRANLFAAHLLISDDTLLEYSDYTQDQFYRCTGYPKELIELRLR